MLDYEHDDGVTAFEDYSRRETPRVFLELLESRASTNQLKEEVKEEIVDMVQECNRFVYRQYRRSTQSEPAIAASHSSEVPPLPSSICQSGNGNATLPTPAQADIIISDLFDFDPYEFKNIFDDSNPLDPDCVVVSNIASSQTMCYCLDSCLCPTSSTFVNPNEMGRPSRSGNSAVQHSRFSALNMSSEQ
jgi:hypothetical protein